MNKRYSKNLEPTEQMSKINKILVEQVQYLSLYLRNRLIVDLNAKNEWWQYAHLIITLMLYGNNLCSKWWKVAVLKTFISGH